MFTRDMKRYASRQANAFNMDDFLGYVGLQRRRDAVATALPVVGILAAGAVIGAGIALFFAPSSGRKLRADLEEKIGEMRDRYLPNVPQHLPGNGIENRIGNSFNNTVQHQVPRP